MLLTRILLVGAALVAAASQGAGASTLPPGFVEVTTAGLTSPTALAVAPDGRIFVAQQGGSLRVIKHGALLPSPFVSLSVDSTGERGLLGVAFDPDFVRNQYVYVYSTTSVAPIHNRVSRFTASGDVALAGSEQVIFELDPLSTRTNHNGGALHFAPDGTLFIASGENGSGPNAQSLANVLGKILRINADGSIPTDNPFWGTAAGSNRAIWALGLRNPYTFAFQPGTGRIFINDVGEVTWEEVNEGVRGANYGWPDTEGPTSDAGFRSPIFAYGHQPLGLAPCRPQLVEQRTGTLTGELVRADPEEREHEPGRSLSTNRGLACLLGERLRPLEEGSASSAPPRRRASAASARYASAASAARPAAASCGARRRACSPASRSAAMPWRLARSASVSEQSTMSRTSACAILHHPPSGSSVRKLVSTRVASSLSRSSTPVAPASQERPSGSGKTELHSSTARAGAGRRAMRSRVACATVPGTTSSTDAAASAPRSVRTTALESASVRRSSSQRKALPAVRASTAAVSASLTFSAPRSAPISSRTSSAERPRGEQPGSRQVGEAGDAVVHELPCRGVREMEVVEHQQEGTTGGDPLDRPHGGREELRATGRGIGDHDVRLPRPPQGAEQLKHRVEGQRGAERQAGGPRHHEVALGRSSGQLGQQPALPDSRLSENEQSASATRGERVE